MTSLEFLRLIVSLAAVNDVSRACFYVPSLKPTFVQICAEDFELRDEHRCDKLLVSMNGTLPAAGNWQRCHTDVLKVNGFTTSPSSTYFLTLEDLWCSRTVTIFVSTSSAD